MQAPLEDADPLEVVDFIEANELDDDTALPVAGDDAVIAVDDEVALPIEEVDDLLGKVDVDGSPDDLDKIVKKPGGYDPEKASQPLDWNDFFEDGKTI